MPSESEATRRWLKDILYHIDLAQGFVAGLDYDAFENDLLRFHAVTRCLEIISESSRRLPDAMKARHPSIQWSKWPPPGTSTVTIMIPSPPAVSGRRYNSPCRPCAPSSHGNLPEGMAREKPGKLFSVSV